MQETEKNLSVARLTDPPLLKMPKRCSIPDCRTSYKQGLMLLCYPKDPWRRIAWMQAVRNSGREPTNNRLICELHFGPDQWEKLRVDGTKKLKWSGVPDVLDANEVEAARLIAQAGGANRTRQPGSHERSPAAGSESKTEHSRDVSPTVARKVFKLDVMSMENSSAILSSSAGNHVASVAQPIVIGSAEANSTSPSSSGVRRSASPATLLPSLASLEPSATTHVANAARPRTTSNPEMRSVSSSDLRVSDLASINNAAALLPLLVTNCAANIGRPIIMSDKESGSASSSSSSGVKANTNQQAYLTESHLPLSCPGHSVVVRLPKSRFQNSLVEDLEDVRSFLNEKERTYEERLINAVKALVKKHELLDQKLLCMERIVQENSCLQAKVLEHQKTLLENHKLKEKLCSYEQKAIVENAIIRKTLSGNGNPIITVQGMQSTQQGRVCHIALQEGAFVTLDDQL